MTLLYADTSALFKRYVEEDESEAVLARMEEASTVGTVLITRVEVAAALAMAVRAQRMDQDEAHEAERGSRGERLPKARATRSCSHALTTSCAKQLRPKAWKPGPNEEVEK